MLILAQPDQPGQCLQGFAQAHVVGENATETVRGEVSEEVEALELVGAQLRRHAGGQIGRDAGFDFAGATLNLFDLLLGRGTSSRVIGELEGVQTLRFGGEFVRRQAQPRQPLVFFLA